VYQVGFAVASYLAGTAMCIANVPPACKTASCTNRPSSRNVEWDGKHNLFDPETLEDLKSPGETGNATNVPSKPRTPT
jgi:hypothetical protein